MTPLSLISFSSFSKCLKCTTSLNLCIRQTNFNIFNNLTFNGRTIFTSNCLYENKSLVPIVKVTSAIKKVSNSLNVFQQYYEKVKHKLISEISKDELETAAYLTYEEIVYAIPIDEFFIEFDMPDTFNSWFTVVELHLWIVSARLMRENNYGYHTRDMITEAFFKDVSYRSSLLGSRASLKRQKQVSILGYQFTAAYYGYDEGVQSDDKVLAAMLWRRFFGFECNNPELIERLVKYIRVQLEHLTFLSFHDIIFQKAPLFIPLSDIFIEV